MYYIFTGHAGRECISGHFYDTETLSHELRDNIILCPYNMSYGIPITTELIITHTRLLGNKIIHTLTCV